MAHPTETATSLIALFRSGSPAAFADLVALFFPRQVRHADRALAGQPLGLCDGEDIALSAFRRLWSEVAGGGRIRAELIDTRSLLAALNMLTAQKIRDARRYDRRLRRDSRRTVRPDDQAGPPCPSAFAGPGYIDFNPLDDLPPGVSDRQRDIARLLWEGWTREEVADRLNCCVRTVYRDIADLEAALREDEPLGSFRNSGHVSTVPGQ